MRKLISRARAPVLVCKVVEIGVARVHGRMFDLHCIDLHVEIKEEQVSEVCIINNIAEKQGVTCKVNAFPQLLLSRSQYRGQSAHITYKLPT